MASHSPIAVQLQAALAQHLKRDPASIRPGDRLREDLGLDSLAMIELLFKVEEHFDLEIPNEDLTRITTVADVTAYVEEKLGQRPEGPGAVAPPRPAPPSPAPVAAAFKPEPARSVTKPQQRTGAVVTSIKAASKRKAAGTAAKSAAPKKKGSRRA